LGNRSLPHRAANPSEAAYDACRTSYVISLFNVECEQRYSVHVAIDWFTGEVLDKQIEPVNE
jgi:hypothetical protein